MLSLKKDKASLKTNIENLTDDEEEILKFAWRKEYQFSKSNETIFSVGPASVIEQLAIASCFFSCMMSWYKKQLHVVKNERARAVFRTYGIYTKIKCC